MKTRMSPANRLNPAPKPLTVRSISRQEAINTVSNLLYSAGLDIDPKVIKKQTKGELVNVINTASLISRRDLASTLGKSFYGKRDLYDMVGWKKDLEFVDYQNMYARNGIAAAVVDIKADECWREFFVLHDGKTSKDWQDDTPFLKAWLELVEKHDLQARFHEVDTALGISRFAVMVIGVLGDTDYSKPLPMEGAKAISFLKVLDEGQVTLANQIKNPTDPRYGLPDLYNCKFEEDGMSVPVHWTRLIHYKQGRGKSSWEGIPGLQKSFNTLQDLDKVSGASSEIYLQNIGRIFLLKAREGFAIPQPGTPEYGLLQEKIDAIEYQLRRVVQLNNMDAESIGADPVDGKAQNELLVSKVAGENRIPQRILMGSEEGKLASTQDVLNMANATAARQKKTCTPWARDTIKHFYIYGFMPPPSSGKFQIEWNSLYQMTPAEKIDLGIKKAQFLNEVTGGNLERGMLVEDLVAETLDGYVLPEPDEPIEKENPETKPKEKPTPKETGPDAQSLSDQGDEKPIGV
jgi:uncharacterized protein